MMLVAVLEVIHHVLIFLEALVSWMLHKSLCFLIELLFVHLISHNLIIIISFQARFGHIFVMDLFIILFYPFLKVINLITHIFLLCFSNHIYIWVYFIYYSLLAFNLLQSDLLADGLLHFIETIQGILKTGKHTFLKLLFTNDFIS